MGKSKIIASKQILAWLKTVGTIIGLLLALVSLTLGMLTLRDIITAPTVYAIVDFRKHDFSPKISDMLRERITKKLILTKIKSGRKDGKTPEKILETVEHTLSKSKVSNLLDAFEIQKLQSHPVIHCVVKNDSSSLIRNVKLSLPGQGQAEISETATVSKQVDWNGEIKIGDIRPKSEIRLEVWFEDVYFGRIDHINPAITYAGGTGKVMERQHFYGWGADMAAWFLEKNRLFQVISSCCGLPGF